MPLYLRCSTGFLLLFLPLAIKAQTGNGANLIKPDSLYHRLSASSPDTATFEQLRLLASELVWTDKPAARKYINRLIEISWAWKEYRHWIMATRLLANLQMTTGNYDSALIINQLALDQLDRIANSKDLEIILYLNRGVFYQSATDYENALQQYMLAYDICEATGITTHLGKILNNLGILYRRLDRKEAARKTYEKALAIKIADQDSLGMANTLNNLGIVEMEMGDEQQSIVTFQRAKSIYLKLGENAEARSVDLALGQAHFNSGHTDLALTTWELALKEPGLKSDARTLAYVFLGLAEIYRTQQDYLQSAEYLAYAEEYAASLQIPRLHADLTRLRAELFQQEGNTDSAAVYFASYVVQLDTIVAAERQKQQQLVAEQFQSKLATAELERQALIIQQQRQEKVLLSLGIGMLALAALGIYLVFYFRMGFQRSEAKRLREARDNEVRQLKKDAEVSNLRSMIEGEEAERQRVAKDLHDGLGGLLATVKARFSDHSAQPAAEANKLLDLACNEVRRIAHNMAPQTLSLSGLTGALEDISAQLNVQGLDCELEVSGEPDTKLDEGQQIMLIRIVQEITHNVVKHAQASKVFIQLLAQADQLLLTIEDDGIGFDPVSKRQTKTGLGLVSIDSRAAFLNGVLLYDSSPDHGTTITLSIPT